MTAATPHPFHVNLGDLPTWLAVLAAAIAAGIALWQLRGQQAEIRRQVTVLERQQADQIDVTPEDVAVTKNLQGDGTMTYQPHWGLAVTNASRRPIRDVAGLIEPSPGASLEAAVKSGFADKFKGTINFKERPTTPLLRPGDKCGFFFLFPKGEYRSARMLVRFTDDLGLHWQIDQNLHLQKLKSRDS
jgi:hypothetical protein